MAASLIFGRQLNGFVFAVSSDRDEALLTPLRAGLDSAALVCSPVASDPIPPPRQTFGQRAGTVSRKTGLPHDPTRPAPPPLRSPNPSHLSVSKVSLLARIIQRDGCANGVLRSAPNPIEASVAAGF
jgi:hypothetical protein